MKLWTPKKRQSSHARLEHINISVADPKRSAAMLCRIFGWFVRWEGPSMDKGYTVHVGSETHYLALYSNPEVRKINPANDTVCPGLNHVAVVVDDLSLIEKRLVSEGLTSFGHANYEPGHRFYFYDFNNIEYEVVSYASRQPRLRTLLGQQLSEIAQNSMYRK